jgi:hypothetical protein
VRNGRRPTPAHEARKATVRPNDVGIRPRRLHHRPGAGPHASCRPAPRWLMFHERTVRQIGDDGRTRGRIDREPFA